MAGSLLAEWLTSLPLGAGLRLMTEKYRPWTFQVALVYFKMGRFSMRHRGATDRESDRARGESLCEKAIENKVCWNGGSLVLKSIEVRYDAVIKG